MTRDLTAGARLSLTILALATVSAACGRGERAATTDGSSSAARSARPAHLPDRLGLGHTPTPARLAALDIDANPAGVGLPAGRGTYADGAKTYAQKCAVCHGTRGEGLGPYPRLIGAEPRQGFPFGTDPGIPKTIGNYWPYPTTVYDYVHRAMPFTAPGSLAPDEVYGLVAFLLAENQVVPRTFVADARTLPAVKMPAHDHFVLDDRKGGAGFR